jgi:predicted dehydrogenase
MRTRVTFVGAGSVARRHVDVLARLGGVEVTAVVDPVEESARLLARDCGAQVCGSVPEALDRGRPDAVYICVPPFAHGPAEKEAVARGLPFFVEKPLAAGLGVAEEVGRLVADAGLLTGTGYHWRCLDTVAVAQQELADRPPLLATGYWLDKRPPVAWWGRRDGSGGQVVEQLTHVLDLARALLGEPSEVYAAGAARPVQDLAPEEVQARGDIDDATAATVRWESGAVATLAATSLLRAKHRAALHTFSEGLVLELSETELVLDEAGQRRTIEPSEDPRLTVDREFLAAVRGERPATRAPYAEALRTHRLACAVADSARTGKPVAVDRPQEPAA